MSVHEFARVGPRALLVAAAVALTACEVNLNSEGIVSRETKTFKVSGVPDVQLETFDGSIEVHSWDRNEVEVEIEKRAMEQSMVDEMVISSEQQGDRIIVKVTQPRNRDFDGIQIGVNFSPTARLRVAVPRNSQLAASSGDGSITVEDVTGKVALTTSDGSVRASRVTGELSVRSGDGSIRLDAVEGKLDLETDDGSIGVEAKPTALRARTADGSIRLRVDADTKMTEDWDVQTADGSVTLTLPSSFDAELDAETRDGSVRANHPAVTNESREGDDREERRRTLKATLGSGGRTLRVRTGDGTIRIES
jgi:Putative adhesin